MTRYAAVLATTLLVGLGGSASYQSALAATQGLQRPQTEAVVRASGSRGWFAPGANPEHPWLYVTGYYNSVLSIYDLSKFGTPKIGQITQGISGPGGVAVDAQGAVYVANQTSGNVTIYPPGGTTPSLTLSQGLSHASGVAVDTNGDVYVSNRGGTPDIVVYPPGQSTPSRTITSNLIQDPAQLVFDSARDLYIADPFAGVSEIKFGSQQPVSLGLQGLWHAGGIDPLNGNLFVGDCGGGKQINVYAPGNPNPVRTLSGMSRSYFMTIGRVRRVEYVFAPNFESDTVTVYRHNATNPSTTLVTGQSGAGAVAFKPADVP
jgi:hypothetical protein